MEINAKPQINASNSENLKKPDEKKIRNEKKSEDARQSTASGPEPDYRVKLSKESLKAAAKLSVDEKASEAAASEKTGNQEDEVQQLSAAAGQQLASTSYGMTTPSAQKMFEAFV